jgi:predicted GNAT family acetyltransferase
MAVLTATVKHLISDRVRRVEDPASLIDSDWFLAQWASMSVTVADNTMASRYEARIDGALAGVCEYDLTPDTIVFLHTVVAQKYEGQGVGGAIARYALDDARARGLHVRALCPFIRGWMERHPEYSDLVRSAD